MLVFYLKEIYFQAKENKSDISINQNKLKKYLLNCTYILCLFGWWSNMEIRFRSNSSRMLRSMVGDYSVLRESYSIQKWNAMSWMALVYCKWYAVLYTTTIPNNRI